jgi:hypothetical protein
LQRFGDRGGVNRSDRRVINADALSRSDKRFCLFSPGDEGRLAENR